MFPIFIYSAFLQDLFCYHSSLKWLNTSLVRKSFGITTGTRHANDSFTVLPAVTSDGNHWNRHCDCKSKTCCLKWWCSPCSSSYLEDLVSESSQTKHSLESTTEMHQKNNINTIVTSCLGNCSHPYETPPKSPWSLWLHVSSTSQIPKH